jgi:hypothetical protein
LKTRILLASLSSALFMGSVAHAMVLGVNTHFDQGWPLPAMDQAKQAGAGGLRDTITWGKVEKSPGRYDFTPTNSGYVTTACARGLPVLLILTPRNRLYDQGQTVISAEGRQAFARFAAAVAQRYPCITAFEIGNEINGHSLKGPILTDMPRSYVAIVDAVRSAVKPQRPDIAILSGSSLSVATGFFADMADAGLLPLVDGIVVHPYLAVPEQLPNQLERLNRLLAKAGATKPIWASEFGFYYQTPEAAPSHALKMIAILDAAGIRRADWYALRDEPWFPNMGLFDSARMPKPALDTFRLATGRLLPAGPARRIDMGDPLTFVYRFGNGPYVLWGSGRTLNFHGLAHAWDARGKAIALPAVLGEPVVVEAPGGLDLGPPKVLADSLTGFAAPGWSRLVSTPQRGATPLDWIDWNWTPYLGATAFPNFRATGNVVTTAHGNGPAAASLVERFTPTEGGPLTLSACFESPPQRPQAIAIRANGRQLWSQTTGSGPLMALVPVDATKGQAIEIAVTALSPGGLQSLRRRIRILSGTTTAEPLCAPASTDGPRPALPQDRLPPDPAE